MALIAPVLSSGKEKAAPKVLIGSGWTAQKLCDCLKDRCLTSAGRSVKPEEIRRRTFATDPVYNNLSNGLAGIRVTIWRRKTFG